VEVELQEMNYVYGLWIELCGYEDHVDEAVAGMVRAVELQRYRDLQEGIEVEGMCVVEAEGEKADGELAQVGTEADTVGPVKVRSAVGWHIVQSSKAYTLKESFYGQCGSESFSVQHFQV
jgi:hypothetical protein